MAEMTFYVGMPDAEMHAILEASCGVKDCTITAQVLFHAATSTYKTVWLSVREELDTIRCCQSDVGDKIIGRRLVATWLVAADTQVLCAVLAPAHDHTFFSRPIFLSSYSLSLKR